MPRTIFASALLAATCLGAAPASAQQQDPASLAAEIAAMRAKIESLEAKVQQLEGAQQRVAVAAPAPSASAAAAAKPNEAKSEFSLKLRGRLQYDAGHVSSPAGVADRGLGFS